MKTKFPLTSWGEFADYAVNLFCDLPALLTSQKTDTKNKPTRYHFCKAKLSYKRTSKNAENTKD